MLSYAVVAEYYCPADSTPYLGFLSESLESDTNGLQAFIGKSANHFVEYLSAESINNLQRTTY